MDNTDPSQADFHTLVRELDELRRHPQWGGVDEPEFRELVDPPGKKLVHAYLQHHLSQGDKTQEPTKPIFYAEIPTPPENWQTAWLIKAFLKQWGDPTWDKREPTRDKERRLEHLLLTKQVDLAILTDIHRLILADDRLLVDLFDWITSFFQSSTRVIPLVIVGEREGMNRLICANSRFIGRYCRIRLPSEPKEPEDPEAESELRSMLGLDRLPKQGREKTMNEIDPISIERMSIADAEKRGRRPLTVTCTYKQSGEGGDSQSTGQTTGEAENTENWEGDACFKSHVLGHPKCFWS